MKKFFVAILAILYLSTSIGTTIHLHYCMGKLVEWGLWDKNGSICSNCGMEREPGSNNKCCKDESKRIKIDNEQKLSENYIQLNETITGTPPIDFPDYSISLLLFSPGKLAKINGPPLCRHTPLNIFNCVFRV
jgi:hypothetical protein